MMQQTSPQQTLDPVAVRKDEGEARWWIDGLALIKATAADTGGQMTIVEITEPPGAETPLHVHHREDEAIWILEGDATLEVGSITIHATEGDYVFAPRGIPRGWKVGSEGCRMIFIFTPGGVEGLIMELSEPAGGRTLPPPPGEGPDLSRILAIAESYGIEPLA